MRVAWVVVVSMLVWIGGAASAKASEKLAAADIAIARDLFREGSRLAEDAQWAEAVDRYRRSLALKRAPITLYSLGIALKNTGRLVESRECLHAFLAEPHAVATSTYVPVAHAVIAELDRTIAHVTVRVQPVAGLAVTLDGATVPAHAWGAPRAIDPGRHVATARASGHPEAQRTFDIAAGETLTLDLPLESEGSDVTEVMSASPAITERDVPLVPWVLVSAGGAAFTAGMVVGIVGVVQAADAPVLNGEREAEAGMEKAIAGDVVAGVGLVAAGVGVIWLLMEADDAPATSDAKADAAIVRPWAADGAGGVAIVF